MPLGLVVFAPGRRVRPTPLPKFSLVQTISHGPFVGACHSERGQADASMRRRVVPSDQQGQPIEVRERIQGGEHPIHAFLQGTIPSFHHRHLAIPMGGKMGNACVFQKFLEGLVLKVFAGIRLQTQGLTSFAALQYTLKDVGDTFTRLVF